MRAALFVLTAGLALLPAGTRAADPPKPPKDGRDADVEALKKEVEALRRRVEALERKQNPQQNPPDQGDRRIVVTSPMARDVVATQPYVGKILARRHIEVCALTTGIVTEVLVREGQAVKKGDVMFKVSPILYRARLDAERADVQIARIEYEHTKNLHENKVVTVISRQEVMLAKAKLERAEAKAKLAEAELNFTVVTAPFDGLVGRLEKQEGSAVKAGDALTTLSDNSVMWVYFNVSEARYLEYMADLGQLPRDRRIELPDSKIELVLANGKKFKYSPDKSITVEAIFNDTGNISFRADFPNPDRLLRHGQAGTVLIHRTLKNVIVIPQRATFEALDRLYVYVVGKDNVLHQREIVVSNEVENLFVVKKGLDVSDRIVLDGVRQVRDGEKVEFEFRRPEEVLATPQRHPEQ